ncbi:hypothetical protein EV426DRAFT_698812 [Tirmania nivea]|nr:hypothetical protein EV426DRAFT_698812 [Tirmania nivea]
MSHRTFSLINGQMTYVPPVGYSGVATIAVHFGADGAIQGASLHEMNLKYKRGQEEAGSRNLEPKGPEEASVAWLPSGVFFTQPSVGKRRRGEGSPGCMLPPWKPEVMQEARREYWGRSHTNKRARHTYTECDSVLPAVVYGRQKWIVRVGRKFRGKTAYTSEGRVVEYSVNLKSGHNRRSTRFERTWRTPAGVHEHQPGYDSQQGPSVAAGVRELGGSAEVVASATIGDATRVLAGPSSAGQSGVNAHSASDVAMGEASAEDASTSVAAEAAVSTEVDMGEAPQGDREQSNEVSQEMELDDASGPCTDLSLSVGEVTTLRGGELRMPGGVGTPRQNGIYVMTEEEDQSTVLRRRIVHSNPQVGPSTEVVQLYCGPVTAALSLPPVTSPVSAGGEPSGAMEDDVDEDLPDAEEVKVPIAVAVEAEASKVTGESSVGVNVTPSKPSTPEISGVTSDVLGGCAVEAVQVEASSSECPQGRSQATPVESSSSAVMPGVASAPASGPELTPAVARSSLSGSQPGAATSAADPALALAMAAFTLRETVAPPKSSADDDLAGLFSGLLASSLSRSNPMRKDRETSKRLKAEMASKTSTHKSRGIQKRAGKRVEGARKSSGVKSTFFGKARDVAAHGSFYRAYNRRQADELNAAGAGDDGMDEEDADIKRREKGKGRQEEEEQEEEVAEGLVAGEEESNDDDDSDCEDLDLETAPLIPRVTAPDSDSDSDEELADEASEAGGEGSEESDSEDGEEKEERRWRKGKGRAVEESDEEMVAEEGEEEEEWVDDEEEEEEVVQVVAQDDGEEEEDSDTPAVEIVLGDDEEL